MLRVRLGWWRTSRRNLTTFPEISRITEQKIFLECKTYTCRYDENKSFRSIYGKSYYILRYLLKDFRWGGEEKSGHGKNSRTLFELRSVTALRTSNISAFSFALFVWLEPQFPISVRELLRYRPSRSYFLLIVSIGLSSRLYIKW